MGAALKKMCACVHRKTEENNSLSKKQDDIKAIIQYLLDTKNVGCFTRNEVEKAIIKVKMIVDKRAVENWFNLLWKLEYLIQPSPKVFALNFAEIAELDVELPLPINQETLDNHVYRKP